MRVARFHNWILLGTAIASSAGCSANSGASNRVEGVWGGPDFQFTATDDSVQTRFPCLVFLSGGPVSLKADGTFEVAGTNEARANLPAGDYSIHLTGRISGRLMQVTYSFGGVVDPAGSAGDVQLIQGQKGNFVDELCVE